MAKEGNWYIGVYGFKQCDYLLQVTSNTQQCVSQCSQHGQCTSSSCVCQAPFNGQYCENKTAPLSLNEQATGYLDQNIWNYYTFSSSHQDNIIITVTQTTTGGDCDLYVRFDGPPSRWQFDYIHITTENPFSLTVPNALGKVIHIGLFGWSAVGYSFTITESTTCNPPCVNGNCTSDGLCLCKDSWFGDACDSQYPNLPSTVLTTKNITSNEWHYFNFVSTSTTVVIALNELVPNPNSGYLYLFVSEAYQPTIWQFDYADFALSKSFHSVIITLDNRPQETISWVIGVYGTGYIINPVSYHLVACHAQ